MVRKVILLFLFLLDQSLAKAQAVDGPFVERVIEIKHFNNAKMSPLLEQLIQNYSENSQLILTCESQGWVVIKLDLSELAGAEQLSEILKQSGFEWVIKEGATRKEVSEGCTGVLIKL